MSSIKNIQKSLSTFILLIILISFSSCYNVNKTEVAPPDKLLSASEMVELLTEIQITEAGFSINKNRKNANNLKPKFYKKILKQHSITTQQFKENINYYHHSPKVMEKIYELVLENLSKIQNNVILEKEEFDKQKKLDSIAAVKDSLNLALVDSLNLALADSLKIIKD